MSKESSQKQEVSRHKSIKPGVIVFHRTLKARGVVMPFIYQTLCDTTSTFVKFDKIEGETERQVTTNLLDIVE